MADLKTKAGTTFTDVLTTELNSLADAGRSGLGSLIDLTSILHPIISFRLAVRYTSSAPSAGVVVAELYLVPALDGTNYAEGSTTVTPQAVHLVHTFESRNGSTSANEILDSPGIVVDPYKYKPLLVNKSGKTYHSSGNKISYVTSLYQSV